MILTKTEIYGALLGALETMKENRPSEWDETDRHWEICLTELEGVVARYGQFILPKEDEENRDGDL